MGAARFKRRTPLVEELCEELSNKIRTGKYRANQWLPSERTLAAKMGVSRTALREALKRLESQGLVAVQHGVGVQVVNRLHKSVRTSVAWRVPNERQRLRQLMEARLLIEPEVARLAARRVTKTQLGQLRDIQNRLGRAKSTAEAARLDLTFHGVLAHACGNEVFALMLDAAGELGAESRRLTIANWGAPRAHAHHEQILAAVGRGDGDGAARLMRDHIKIAAQDLAKQLNHTST